MNSTTISIIMPIYNSALYLRPCLDSIINQTLTDFEFICINDGSTDNSLNILTEYANRDTRLKILNKKNSGAADCRNLGLSEATGQYCIFLDSDDLFSPYLLEKLYSQIYNVDADICFCDYSILSNGNKSRVRIDSKVQNPFTPSDELNQLFQITHPVCWNKLYKTEFLKKHQLQFLNQSSSNDISFVYSSLVLASSITFVSEALIEYRFNNINSITSNTNSKISNVFNAYNKLFEIIAKQPQPENYFESFYTSLNDVLSYYCCNPQNKLKIPLDYSFLKNKKFSKFLHQKETNLNILNAILYQRPLISIVVPVYNAETYLVEALDSLLVQTQQNIEILCVNDGSKDHSLEILQNYAYKDKRIKVFDQQNSGPAKARNTGLDNASGVYLMFCDADDWYEPNMCQEMLSSLILHKTDFVMCDCNIIEQTPEHHRDTGCINYHYLNMKGFISLNQYNKQAISVTLWNKIFNTETIKKYTFNFPSGYEMDDDAFIFQYLAISNTVYGLDKKLYNYRLLGNSIMGKLYSKQTLYRVYDVIKIFAFCIVSFKRNNLFNDKKWFLRIIQSKVNWALSLLSYQGKYEFLKQLRENVLHFYDKKDLKEFPLLLLCSKKKYAKALELLTQTKKVKIFGITVFKKKKSQLKTKYYVLGIKIFSKRASLKQYLDYKFYELASDLQGKTTYLDKQISQIKSLIEKA